MQWLVVVRVQVSLKIVSEFRIVQHSKYWLLGGTQISNLRLFLALKLVIVLVLVNVRKRNDLILTHLTCNVIVCSDVVYIHTRTPPRDMLLQVIPQR